MKAAFKNYLLAYVALTALIGDRLTWAVRPQGSALPSIALHVVSGDPLYDDDGEVGLARARIQLDCWGSTYDSAEAVAQLVKARLSRDNGAEFIQDGIYFEGSFLENEQDDFERGAGDEEFYRVRLDFILWHKEL